MKYNTIKAAVFDMDGVLWREEQPMNGLVELFDWLTEAHIPYALATNNSSKTQADYVAKLARLGVMGVPERAIITSSVATAAYLKTVYPAGTRVFVVGMKGIREALADAGFDLLPPDADPTETPPEIVVAGVDFALTYNRLKTAALFIRAGADFYGTNGDLTYPSELGLVPGAGSILAALTAATDRQPVVIGKPAMPMYEIALQSLGDVHPGEALMVGDRIDTDIAGAKVAGMQTALVFTGVTQPDDLTGGEVWPDVAYEDLPALLRAWAGDDWYRAKLKARRNPQS